MRIPLIDLGFHFGAFFSLRCVAELGLEFSKAVVVIVSTFLPLFHCVPRNDGNETQVRRKSSIYSNMSECEWNFEENAFWNRQLHNQRYSSELNQKNGLCDLLNKLCFYAWFPRMLSTL